MKLMISEVEAEASKMASASKQIEALSRLVEMILGTK